MFNKRKVLLAFGLMALYCIQGQVIVYEDYVPDKQLIYLKENKFSGFIHTSGLGVGYQWGKYNIRSQYSGWLVEATNMNHSKSSKVDAFGSIISNMNARRYSFGKINSVVVLRGGYIKSHTLNEKPYWGGVNLALDYSFGLSVAMAIPQYLSIIYVDRDPLTGKESIRRENERFNPNNPKHQTWDQIFGNAPLFYHFWEISPYPGLFAKAGLNFEFGSNEKKVNSIEVGMIFDIYLAKIPMMALNPYRNFFFNFYLTYQFGKRYGLR